MPVSNPHAPLRPSAPPSPLLQNCSATSQCEVPAAWFRFGKFLPNSLRPAPCHRKTCPSGVGVHLGQVRLEGKGVMRPLEGLAPPPIGAQRYPQKEAIFFQERVFQKCANAERKDGHFHHPCQEFGRCSCADGSPPHVEKAPHPRQLRGGGGSRGEPFGLTLVDGYTGTRPRNPTALEAARQGRRPLFVHPSGGRRPQVEGVRQRERKRSQRELDKVFLEDPEPQDDVVSENEDEMGPPWFCSTPIQTTEDDAKDDGYEEFRRRLGMEVAEPVPCHQRKKGLPSIVRIVVYATPAHDTVLKHCLREKLFEDCEGCVIGAPGQRHQDLVAP
ncbi:uncharacterized protein LOC142024918 [Carettochelys insculpta]|uniref:uncharacterized protein LOC142024918 n=1 Tax=Carettochelys insculpta TaxID=44489 RepID=UPI003EB96ECE